MVTIAEAWHPWARAAEAMTIEYDNDEPHEGQGQEGSVEVPYTDLSPETLSKVIEDLVTRDGTDYGDVEKTLEQKSAALMRQLESGEAKLVVDLATETIGLMTAADLKRAQRST